MTLKGTTIRIVNKLNKAHYCDDFVDKALENSKRIFHFIGTKVEIPSARSANRTCQNPFIRSNFVTYLAFPTWLIQSSILGIGKVSVLVTLFTFM